MFKKIQLLAVAGLVLAVGANAEDITSTDTTTPTETPADSSDSTPPAPATTTTTSTAQLTATINVPGTRFFGDSTQSLDFGDITGAEEGSDLKQTATFKIYGNSAATVTITAGNGKFIGSTGGTLGYTAAASFTSESNPTMMNAELAAGAAIATGSIGQGGQEGVTLEITTPSDAAKAATSDAYTETFTVQLASTN